MITLIYILILATLIFIVIQDLKDFAISLFLFPILFGLSIAMWYLMGFNFNDILSNLLFISMLITSLIVYISIKEKKLTNIFINHFGLGDLLFFIAISPLFSNINFVIFIISGMIFILVFHSIISLIFKNKTQSKIPLAGYLSIYLGMIFTYSYFINHQLTYINLI